VNEMSFKSRVKGRGSDSLTDGENEGDDCDEVICVGLSEPGGE